jgi:hypothetical protein
MESPGKKRMHFFFDGKFSRGKMPAHASNGFFKRPA